ncbi:MAG: hypothetical protein JWP85_163 [Rhodoglobus sp.]|nr:hypothetical protein [Rhodoglobus sp.]
MNDDTDRYEDEDEPELAGYEPHGEKPLRSPHLHTVMRVVVVLGLIALVLPGILVTATTANRTASATCEAYARFYAPDSVGFASRFELVSPAGIGWNCYAIEFGGEETLLKSLGLIPGGPVLPRTVPLDS